jgi:hypothetical protein
VRGQACFVCKRLSEGNYSLCFALHPTDDLGCKWSIRQALREQKLAIPTAHEQVLEKNTCLPSRQRQHPKKAKKKVVGVESVYASPKFKSIAAQCPMYSGFLGKFFYI